MTEERTRKCTDTNKPYCIGPKKKDKNITNCYGEPYDVEKEFNALFDLNDPGYLESESFPNSYCVGLDSAIITNAAEADRQLQKVFQNPEYKSEVSNITSVLTSDNPDVDTIINMLTEQLNKSKPFLRKALTDDTMINYIKKVIGRLKIKWDTVSNTKTPAADFVEKLEQQVIQYETNKPNMLAEIERMINSKVDSINSAEFKKSLAKELVELKKQQPEIIINQIINETQRQISSSLQGIIKIGLFTMLRAEDITLHTVEQLFPNNQTGGASPWLDKLKSGLGIVRNIVGSVLGLPVLVAGAVGGGAVGFVGGLVFVFITLAPMIAADATESQKVYVEDLLVDRPLNFILNLAKASFNILSGTQPFDEAPFSGGKSLRRRHKKTRKGSRRQSVARRSVARRSTLARRKKSRKSRRNRSRK